MDKRFVGKIALVTGGAAGIGKAVATRVGTEGAALALFDCDKDLLFQTVEELKEKNIQAMGIAADISDEQQVIASLKEVESRYGKIDVLVNSAGIVGPTDTNITHFLTEEFDRICAVNLRGAFLMTKYTLQIMEKANKGRILLIASIAGKEGNPGMVGYSTTKAGVIGLVKGVAKEYAHTEITVNGLAPAVIKTAMNENTASAQLAYMVSKIPMKRLGTVEEVAALCSFIVSDENSFSTGFIYDISGGRATY